MANLKCVVVGNNSVGKTSLLISYTTNVFPEDYMPTVEDNYSKSVVVNGVTINLNLFDTNGNDDHDRLRPLSYPDTNIVLICFSVVSQENFTNVELKWVKEIEQHLPNVPIILVGTKADLRNDEMMLKLQKSGRLNIISKSSATDMAEKIGAACYKECSARTQIGLKALFDEVCDLYLKKSRNIKENLPGRSSISPKFSK